MCGAIDKRELAPPSVGQGAVDRADDDGITPLFMAEYGKHDAVIALLRARAQ